jgi:hypothetical protein
MSTPNEVAPERVWWCDGDAFTLGAGGPCKLCVPYIRADTVTPNEVVDALVAALRALEWEPDPDFKADYCLNCGKERRVGHSPACSTGAALSRYEATRKTRGGTDGGPG